MDINATTLSIAGVIALFGFIMTAFSFFNTRRRETVQDTASSDHVLEEIRTANIKLNLKLDAICATTNDIKADQKATATQVRDLETKIIVMERDLKTAFNIIDELKGR